MFKHITWLAGCIFWGWLAYKFAAWKVLAQMALVTALFLWVVCGGLLLAHLSGANAPRAGRPATDKPLFKMPVTRDEWVARYGPETAAAWEKYGKAPWQQDAPPPWVSK